MVTIRNFANDTLFHVKTMWVIVGTDSGYEGKITIYNQVDVELEKMQ
ncbi:hypothetical protein MNB_SV-4-1372 [hydrothermal vent metagenome]|uniref:Uncharacterized protein n=1 Tax=hydrothermal vent metagenome TaxID=652676 RepID=A0A1W1E982_9ZZZZ